jgi:Tfp pilus assembly protein FimT
MSHTTQFRRPGRPAFTLVEMLVSTALIMFMMYIIAAAFEKGIESFRTLKTAGDMQDRLRSATTALRMDLTRQHFGNQLMVSDQRLDQNDWRITTPSDEGGYFRIYQGNDLATIAEGIDPDDQTSLLRVTRSNGTQHVLQFTVRLRPDEYRRDLFFSTDTRGVVPATAAAPNRLCDYSTPDYMRPKGPTDPQDGPLSTTFASKWAEVIYFLRQSGQSPGGTPLYTLYRRQKLLVEPNGNSLPSITAVSPTQLLDVSYWQVLNLLNGPKDITVPGRRFGVNQTAANSYNQAWIVGQPFTNIKTYGDEAPTEAGGDILLSNVVSFEVKALWDIPTDGTVFWIAAGPGSTAKPSVYPPQPANNADYPFDNLPVGMNPVFQNGGIRVFDTWSKEQGSNPIGYSFYDPTSTGTQLWNQGQFRSDTNNPLNPTIPLRVRMRAVQIKLRIWDQKSQQTRQTTLIQDL